MLELSGQQQLSTFQSPVTAAIPQLTVAEDNGGHVSHGNGDVNEIDSDLLSGRQQLSTFQSPVTADIPQLTAAENNGDHVSHGNEEVNEGDSERELIAVANR
ncbi:hypothetical protein PR003_g34734, partial [Phytophthora rubi]